MKMEREYIYSKSLKYVYRLAPILVLMTFYFFTIVFFEFGPTEWPADNKTFLYIYLFLAYLFMFIGYLIGIRNKKISIKKDNIKMFKLFLIIYIIMLPLTSFGRIGSFIPTFFFADVNFGEQYYGKSDYKIVWIEYIRFIFAPILFVVFPLGIFLWKKLSKYWKFLFVSAILYYIFIDVSKGTNKSIAEHIVLLLLVGLLVIIKNNKKIDMNLRLKFGDIRFLNKVLYAVITIIIFIIFINVFTLFISSRTTNIYNQYAGTYLDLSNPLLFMAGTENQKFGLASLMSYLTQGYYGLSLALDKPFIFSYGMGYSSFLLENISQLGYSDVKYDTYAYRLFDENWPTGRVWSSFFVWPASDITFIGVLFLMCVIGYLLGSTWIESILGNNYMSLAVFSLLSMLAIYIPMNNQIFQGGELFIASWFWIGLLVLSKIRKILK